MSTSRSNSTISSDCLATIRFTAPFRVQKNLLQVPFSFHRQWLYRYPKYVLFHYDDNKYFIRVRRHDTSSNSFKICPCFKEAWFHLLDEKKLIPGDEVVFYYQFGDHAWELLVRKGIEWDNDDINFDD
ncbi:hypothetical protein GmHk_15G044389 [Glycine max]|nr:hypothetical protein GmHk_15G044389 [Glycine max]